MTLNELRDWHAARAGWELRKYGKGKLWFPKGYPACSEHLRQEENHPFPPTLDGAASAMPEGLRLGITSYTFDAWNKVGKRVATTLSTGDEIHDRYMLAKAACEAMDKEKA